MKEKGSPKPKGPQVGGATADWRRNVSSPFQNYTFVDYATQGYLALVGLIVVCLHNYTVPLWPLLVVAHATGIGLVHMLIQSHAIHPNNRVLEFLRHFYPVLLYVVLYRETGELNHMLTAGFLDPFFIRVEARIFGLQPSLAFMNGVPYLAVSEPLYAAYFSFYFMVAGVGLALFYRNREQFFHYLSVISFLFYVCYLIYIFLPVVGPPIFFEKITDYKLPAEVQPAVAPAFPSAIQTGVFYQIMAWIYHTFEAPGASFPSSHVAIAIGTVYFSFQYLRSIRWLHLTTVILLCLGTIYCRYHYVMDVLGGAVTAAVLIPIANLLYFKLRKAV